MAALARRLRACPADTVAIETARRRLGHDWRDYAIIEVTQALVEQAGDYADTFAPRGYDSVQLAAARTLYEPGHEPVLFACFDRRLQIAARVLGLGSVHLPDLPG